VFNTNPNSADNGNIFAFHQGNKGVLVTAQATYLYNQGPNNKGMQGQYIAGFFEDNNSFPVLPSGGLRSGGNSGFFILGQQMVYRPQGPGTSQGLTIWGAWSNSPKELVSPLPMLGGAGVCYEGLIRRRKSDVISAGWIYGKTSKWLPDSVPETLLELNYQWVAKRYITVTPDFQYIWHPIGKNEPGSSVFGLQLNLTL
jgi:porin